MGGTWWTMGVEATEVQDGEKGLQDWRRQEIRHKGARAASQSMGRWEALGGLWAQGLPHGSRALDGAASHPWGSTWSWDEHQVHLVWTWLHLQCVLQKAGKQAHLPSRHWRRRS